MPVRISIYVPLSIVFLSLAGLALAEPVSAPHSATGAAVISPATPQDFANQLVAHYDDKAHTRDEANAWDRWYDSLYDPEFSKLVADNRTLASHYEGIGLDHDPLCGCQSSSGFFRIFSVGLRPDGFAEVRGSHCYLQGSPADCTDVDLVLKRIDGSWKLYDAMEHGSIRDRLARENTCMGSPKSEACLGKR